MRDYENRETWENFANSGRPKIRAVFVDDARPCPSLFLCSGRYSASSISNKSHLKGREEGVDGIFAATERRVLTRRDLIRFRNCVT